MLVIGSLVDGKYKVLNKIGQGGMSVVYLAMNERANKQWAIKEVRKDGIQNFEIVRQGLIAETDILKELHHPYLPSIVDIVDQDDSFLIVMDYIEGNPLSRKLEEEGAQPQELVIQWAKQMCDVLGYLHSQKPPIIYRDLKPGNVMLKPDGNITLIDFGTARKFKEHGVKDTTCLGTVGYAAPEQFGGRGQTDARTDIYCLGATIYHLVTGCDPSEPPYQIRPIRKVNPNLSAGLEQIIVKCTKRNPAERYQSCAELMYALEHYDEIDEQYLGVQRRHFATFAVLACLTLVCFAVGLGTQMAAARADTRQYDKLIDAADKKSAEDAIPDLEKAITLKPGDTKAYQKLIEAFQDDNVLSSQEDETLNSVWTRNEQAIKRTDQDAYLNLCFSIGTMYWYHYEEETAADDDLVNAGVQKERRRRAKPYFQIVATDGREDAASPTFDTGEDVSGEGEEKTMARVYWNIADLMEQISLKSDEGTDATLYQPLFKQLEAMLKYVDREDEREIVKLESYRLVINVIDIYGQRFVRNGVSQEELRQLAKKAFTDTKAISNETASEKIQGLKKSILDREESVNYGIDSLNAAHTAP